MAEACFRCMNCAMATEKTGEAGDAHAELTCKPPLRFVQACLFLLFIIHRFAWRIADQFHHVALRIVDVDAGGAVTVSING
jgi:hypothetical protein